MSSHKPLEFETDVLIIGGGGAATAATLAAHENGARTLIAIKGKFGVPGVRGAGATSNPVGDFWTIRTIGPKGGLFNPPDSVWEDMMQTGLGMADRVDDDGNMLIIRANAVVIATGGVGQLFEYSFNPPGNTGDGYAMALRAGADLYNMEFMQQGLATTWPNQGIVMLYEMKDPYRLINHKGKAFLEDYLPDGVSVQEVCQQKSSHWPISCRDQSIYLDRAIKRESVRDSEGKLKPIFLDMSQAEREFLPELFPAFMMEKGIDVTKDLLQVQNHHHTSNGGIRVDEDAHSAVTGLFAVGEAAGWQGADRLGGTMLGGSQVFGWRAGKKAAEVAKQGGTETPIEPLMEESKASLMSIRALDGSASVESIHARLQRVMWDSLIVEKDHNVLENCLEEIQAIRETVHSEGGIRKPEDHALFAELNNMMDVGECITQAADYRTESRGSHIRTDYPDRDDQQWLTNVFIKKADGNLQLRKQWVAEETGWIDRPGDVRISPWG